MGHYMIGKQTSSASLALEYMVLIHDSSLGIVFISNNITEPCLVKSEFLGLGGLGGLLLV